jgi:prophage regulatory protein
VERIAMTQRLLCYSDLRDKKGISLSRCQLWRLEKQGKFPRRVSISPSRHAWLEHEIDAHIEALVAARDTRVGGAG